MTDYDHSDQDLVGMAIDNQNHSADYRLIAVVQKLILRRQGSLNLPIRRDDELIEIGLTSIDIARLVLLVEDEFNLTFPPCDLIPANFRSISTIGQLVTKLTAASKPC